VDDTRQDYSFMRDQYLELLWAAQKMEDRRLMEMVLLRLKYMAIEMTVAPTPACEIIPFPGTIIQTATSPDFLEENRPLWPRQPLRHLVSILCGYCAVVVFFALFGLSA
jgi:hypothetical protein